MVFFQRMTTTILKVIVLVCALPEGWASPLQNDEEYSEIPQNHQLTFMFQPNFIIDLNAPEKAVQATLEAFKIDASLKWKFATPLKAYVVFKDQFQGTPCPYHILRTDPNCVDAVGDDKTNHSSYSVDFFPKALEGIFLEILKDFGQGPCQPVLD